MKPASPEGILLQGRDDKSKAREEGECEKSNIQDATT